MNNNFMKELLKMRKVDTPGIAMQAILSGIDKRITDESFY